MKVELKQTGRPADFSKWYFEDDFSGFKEVFDKVLAHRMKVVFENDEDSALDVWLDREDVLQIRCAVRVDDWGSLASVEVGLRELLQDAVKYGELDVTAAVKELKAIADELLKAEKKGK